MAVENGERYYALQALTFEILFSTISSTLKTTPYIRFI